MDIKIKAYELFSEGMSYKEIAQKLGIGKTTAFGFVKEMKLVKSNQNPILGTVPNGSELVRNQNSERKISQVYNSKDEKGKINLLGNADGIQNVPNKAKIKVITGDELLNLKFEVIPFTGKFFELIGKPEKGFSAIVFGKPKEGKSNFSLRFADYLQEYFGKTIYVAAEEGNSFTMQDKIRELKGSKMNLIESRSKEAVRDFIKDSQADFVFIDSINVLGIDDVYLELLKQENPKTAFIAIVQATKEGNFKGAQSLEHNCDFVIRVEKGIAYHRGRFGPESEVAIFKEPLYEKNQSKEPSHEVKETKVSKTEVSNELKLPTLKIPLNNDKPNPIKMGNFPTKQPLEQSNGKKNLPHNHYSSTSNSSGLGKLLALFVAGAILVNVLDE